MLRPQFFTEIWYLAKEAMYINVYHFQLFYYHFCPRKWALQWLVGPPRKDHIIDGPLVQLFYILNMLILFQEILCIGPDTFSIHTLVYKLCDWMNSHATSRFKVTQLKFNTHSFQLRLEFGKAKLFNFSLPSYYVHLLHVRFLFMFAYILWSKSALFVLATLQQPASESCMYIYLQPICTKLQRDFLLLHTVCSFRQPVLFLFSVHFLSFYCLQCPVGSIFFSRFILQLWNTLGNVYSFA